VQGSEGTSSLVGWKKEKGGKKKKKEEEN